MRHTILGKKLGMTQIFDQTGNAVPVTIVQAGPCTVLQVKTASTDGYNAVQLGFGEKKEKHTTKPMAGHFRKAGSAPLRHVRETRVDDPSLFRVGQAVTVGIFARGDIVDITGTSKGKGFAGVMKRHGFSGFSMTHGTHESKRGPGSIGQSADPAKVFKNMKMPGQMGSETVTVQNLRIVDVREAQNLLLIKGPVPGGKNGLLVISHAVKKEAPPMREIAAEEPTEEQAPDPDDLSSPASGTEEGGVEGEGAMGEVTTTPEASEETASGEAPEGEAPSEEASGNEAGQEEKGS